MLIRTESLALTIIKGFVGKPVFSDIETENLGGVLSTKRIAELSSTMPNLDLTHGIRLIQLYQPLLDENNLIVEDSQIVYIIDLDYINIEVIKEAIKPLHTVWAGANFDFGCLRMTTAKYDDIQLLARTAYPQLPAFSLDTLTKYLVKQDLYKDLDKKSLQKKGFRRGEDLTEEQIYYSAVDVYALSLIWRLKKIQDTRLKDFYKLDMKTLKYTIDFQQNGALVDMAKVREELDKLPSLLEQEERVLQGVNSKSPKQVKEKFRLLLGTEPTATDKPFLIDMITTHEGSHIAEFAKAVYDNRRTRLRETNLNNLLVPIVETRFNPYGTVTGRYSSSGKDIPNGINFQNITRDLQYLTEQDTEDTVVIHADYGTAELRAACSIMKDFKMRQYLLDKIDLHKVSARLADTTISKLIDVTKAQRQKGKAVSFGFIFGMSWSRFKEYAYTDYGVVFTDEEAKAVKKAYQDEYPDITQYHVIKWRNYKTVFVESPMGRLNKPRLGTDAINYGTQSCIGETCKLAVCDYVEQDYDTNIRYIFSQIHDAILLRVPRSEYVYQSYILVRSMFKAWDTMLSYDMLQFKDIPMEIEFMVLGEEYKMRSLKELENWYNTNKG